jgi:nitroreductase
VPAHIGEEKLKTTAETEGARERTVEDVVLSRHSVRRFQDRPVPEDTLLKLFSLAQRAPSDWNLQPWRWLVLTQLSQREKLQALVPGDSLVLRAPVAIVVLASTREWERAADHLREYVESGRYTEEQFSEKVQQIAETFRGHPARAREFAVKNTMLALMTLALVAQGEGLGTGFLGDFDEVAIRKAFEIPEELAVAAIVTLGYPSDDPPKTLRKALGEVVHWQQMGGKRGGA